MSWSRIRPAARLLVLALSAGVAAHAHAQAARGNLSDFPDSRVDLYAGYGWFHPINSGIDGKQYQDVTNPNATASATFWFNHFVGVQMEGGYFSGNAEHRMYNPACGGSGCDQLVYTAEAGPVLRLPMGRFVPFIHALGGGERANGPVNQPLFWGWGVTGGAGVDYILPFFNKRFAVRPIQADFQYSQVVYGPLALPAGTSGGLGEIDALKLSGGLTARFGAMSNRAVLAVGCVAEPAAVYAGEPISATATTTGLDPRRKASFTWAANAGHLKPEGAAATVDTAGLAPGEYSVGARVSQGPKARQQAECNAPFTVKPVLPPTISCTANPATAVSGTTIEISTTGTSPSNRPLSYTYTATAGQITGSGTGARLTTAGMGAANITITCNVTDDMGQRATATTTVTISNPVVPVIPDTQKLCSIGFTRDRRRPVRVDNEAKACLDDVALTLTQQADAKLVMVGNTSPEEPATDAAERVLNARQYLTQEKGIDSSRIELRAGKTSGRSADNILVPSGASFVDTETQLFDEHAIVRHGEAYGVHAGSAGEHPRASRPRKSRSRRARAIAATPQTEVAPAASTAAPVNPSVAPVAAPEAAPRHTRTRSRASHKRSTTAGDLNIAPVATPEPSTQSAPSTPVTSIPALK